MAIRKLKLTKEQLSLISNLRMRKLEIVSEKSDILKPARLLMNIVSTMPENENTEVVKGIAEELYEIARAAKQTEIDNGDKYYGIDIYDPFKQEGDAEDTYDWVAKILGNFGEVTNEDKEVYDKLIEFVLENFVDIEDLIHQRTLKGGVSADITYVSDERIGLWFTEDEWNKRNQK